MEAELTALDEKISQLVQLTQETAQGQFPVAAEPGFGAERKHAGIRPHPARAGAARLRGGPEHGAAIHAAL